MRTGACNQVVVIVGAGVTGGNALVTLCGERWKNCMRLLGTEPGNERLALGQLRAPMCFMTHLVLLQVHREYPRAGMGKRTTGEVLRPQPG